VFSISCYFTVLTVIFLADMTWPGTTSGRPPNRRATFTNPCSSAGPAFHDGAWAVIWPLPPAEIWPK
jgi:hypothetical protein